MSNPYAVIGDKSLHDYRVRVDVLPEEALQAACARFSERFRHIEKRAKEQSKVLSEMTLEEMDELWEEAKGKTEE